MQFGMPFLLENSSVEDAVRLAAALGLDFVELNMSFPICQAEHVSARMLKDLQNEYGIYFTFHLDEEMAPCTFSPAIRHAWHQVAREAITLAREADVPAVNLHWLRGVYVTLPDGKQLCEIRHLRIVLRILRRILSRRRIGIRLAEHCSQLGEIAHTLRIGEQGLELLREIVHAACLLSGYAGSAAL